MENLNLGDLYLSKEESKDIIEYLTKKRNIKNYKSKSSNELFKAIKNSLKIKKNRYYNRRVTRFKL